MTPGEAATGVMPQAKRYSGLLTATRARGTDRVTQSSGGRDLTHLYLSSMCVVSSYLVCGSVFSQTLPANHFAVYTLCSCQPRFQSALPDPPLSHLCPPPLFLSHLASLTAHQYAPSLTLLQACPCSHVGEGLFDLHERLCFDVFCILSHSFIPVLYLEWI